MPLPNHLPEETIRELFPSLNDQLRVLAEFATRLTQVREPISQSAVVGGQMPGNGSIVSQGLQRTNPIPNIFLDVFKDDGVSPLNAYLTRIGNWSAQMSTNGITYSEQLRFLDTNRRFVHSAVLEKCEPGCESQLVLNALDSLDAATRTTIALACLTWVQQKLRQSAWSATFQQLMAGMTHSHNNALATIIGRAQLLEENERRESVRAELRAIATSAQTIADDYRIIQDKPRQSVEELVPVNVNLVVLQAIQQTRFRWHDEAKADGVSINILQNLTQVPDAWGNAELLQSAVVELIMNALDAVENGGKISINTGCDEHQVLISVHDTGSGMDPEVLSRALEPFFSTRGMAHPGLGLTRVQEITELFDGSLSLNSSSEQGTTATIRLSLISDSPVLTQASKLRAAPVASVLVIDDESEIRSIVRRASILSGYRVVEAESGADGMRLFREDGPFEVVLCDFGMPKMNGFEIARAVRVIDPKCIFILITGWASKFDSQKMHEAGIDRTLTKPFTIERVAQLISEALVLRDKL